MSRRASMDKGREASAVKGVSVRAGGPRQSRSTKSSQYFHFMFGVPVLY